MFCIMRRKCGLQWKELFSFQTKLLQQSFLERPFVSPSFRATGEEDFAPTLLASLQPCGAKQEPEFGVRTLLWLLVRGPECAMATAWPGQQAQPWGHWCSPRGGTSPAGLSLLSHHTLRVHPPHLPEQNQASRGKSYWENIPAPQGLQGWEDSSLHKGSHKLQHC